MGIFNFFRKPFVLQDAALGTLYFEKGNKEYTSHYQTMVFFAPVSQEVDLLIAGTKDGVDEHARKLYNWLLNNYTVLQPKIEAKLEGILQNTNEHFIIKNFNEQFKLNCINLWGDGTEPFIWYLEYLSIHDEHDFGVTFKDYTMTNLEIET